MKLRTLADLFHHQLLDVYGGESQMLYALPKMARSAIHPRLMEGFDAQLEETKDHLERLLNISDELGCRCHTKGAKALEHMLEAAWSHISDASDELVRDARLLRAAQSAAHYEIAAYQAAWTSASSMGMKSVADMLRKTLQEEHAAGQRLRTIAQKMMRSPARRGRKVLLNPSTSKANRLVMPRQLLVA
ncbi:DUF892 family protein [Brevifollis gellanilyticus]|nr:DUF892 family protein [Brevifollis gellanilyticus]